MPVAQDGPAPLRQAVLVGLGAILAVLSVLFLVTQMDRLLGRTDLNIEIGDGQFRPGKAVELADDIDTQGPFFFSDLAGGDRDIWLNYNGTVSDSGDDDGDGERQTSLDDWYAFAAREPTSPRGCFVEWQDDAAEFVDSCDGTVYPETGAGLPHYPVNIDANGTLSIDLNATPTIDDEQ